MLAIFLPGEYKRMKFVMKLHLKEHEITQSMKLHLKVNSLESFTSQSFNYICQEKIMVDDYGSVN